jgi:hypothetical protein
MIGVASKSVRTLISERATMTTKSRTLGGKFVPLHDGNLRIAKSIPRQIWSENVIIKGRGLASENRDEVRKDAAGGLDNLVAVEQAVQTRIELPRILSVEIRRERFVVNKTLTHRLSTYIERVSRFSSSVFRKKVSVLRIPEPEEVEALITVGVIGRGVRVEREVRRLRGARDDQVGVIPALETQGTPLDPIEGVFLKVVVNR